MLRLLFFGNFSLRFVALLLSGLLVSCAFQSYQAKPLQPEATAQAFAARTAADAGLSDTLIWDLPALTQAALRLHPDLQVARAQWLASKAQEKTAAQRPELSINAGGEHHSRADDGISPWTYTLGIGVTIETHGKREARIEQAEALSEAARLDIAATAWQVRSRVRARLLDYYAARNRIQNLQQQQQARAGVDSMLETRLAAGLASTVEAADARLQLQRLQAALDAENGRLSEARAALASAIGLPDQALDDTRLGFTSFESDPAPPADLQRIALQNRLDIRKQMSTYAASEAALRLEIAKQYPDITLGPTFSWDQGDNRWGLDFTSLLALLNKNRGPIAAAEANREVEAKRFEALQIGVIGEQQQAAAALQSALNELQHARKLLNGQDNSLNQIQKQFDAGMADRLELTLGQLELQTAQAAVTDANIKAQQALGRLEDVVQQPLDGSADAVASFNKNEAETK